MSTRHFDVFLSHNSLDKPTVKELGRSLRQRGLNVWLDDWELRPGQIWHNALEQIIMTCRSAAVCIGKSGIGPWVEPEMQALLRRFIQEKDAGSELAVIPLLLPRAPESVELPLFLQAFTWVDLREGFTPEGLDHLEWGITGRKPNTEVDGNHTGASLRSEVAFALREFGSSTNGEQAMEAITSAAIESQRDIEVTVDVSFDSLTEDEQARLLQLLKQFSGIAGKITLVDKRRGSVKFTFRLSEEDAEKLIEAAQTGKLDDLGVVHADGVEPDDTWMSEEPKSQVLAESEPVRSVSTTEFGTTNVRVEVFRGTAISDRMASWESSYYGETPRSLGHHPRWLLVLQKALGHTPYCLEAFDGDKSVGLLPLSFVRSALFGRFLVSLPYTNSGGVLAKDDAVVSVLINEAVNLAKELDVRYLELRQSRDISHPLLNHTDKGKTNLVLPLSTSADSMWEGLGAKVRNQVRKAMKSDLSVTWGGHDQLSDFYGVFSRNMRDLGTPVYGKRLFAEILRQFEQEAEICVIRHEQRPVAAALLTHGKGIAEVPSASSLREYNHLCANMLLYWHLIQRAIERGQSTFSFGRSTVDSASSRFKRQWGAQPEPSAWLYYSPRGEDGLTAESAIENKRYERLTKLWSRLPLWLTRLIGPSIAGGAP